MKTIKDIAAEMRNLVAIRDWHNHTNQSNRERILDFADRIEQAVTNCNQLKAREALKKAEKTLSEFMGSCDCLADVRAALDSPPRNCDLYKTEAEAYRGWERYYNSMEKHKDGYLDYEDWHFAEAKGERND